MKTLKWASFIAILASILGLTAPQSGAQIIYSGSQSIESSLFSNAPYLLDINNDGQIDFQFFSFESAKFIDVAEITPVSAAYLGEFSGNQAGTGIPIVLPVGATVDESVGMWWSAPASVALPVPVDSSTIEPLPSYLGVKLTVDGLPHFGWLEYSGVQVLGTRATLLGWAYELQPNVSIAAGDTGGAVPEASTFTVAASILLAIAAGFRYKKRRRQQPLSATCLKATEAEKEPI